MCDDRRECSFVLGGIVDVEALRDEVGVALVLGKDDRLAEPVATGDLVSSRHEYFERLVDGVGVEQPFVDGLSIDGIGILVIVVTELPILGLPALLLLVGQVVVLDPVALKSQRHVDCSRRDEVAVIDGFLEFVVVGGNTGLEPEELKGVEIDVVLRGGGGEAEQERVEVLEDPAVLLVHGSVRLVDDDEIEVTRTEAASAVVDLVDQAHHRRIGRYVDAAVGALVGQQVHRWRLG